MLLALRVVYSCPKLDFIMGGGNGQKSATARARNQAKAAKNGKSGGGLLGKVIPMHKCKRLAADCIEPNLAHPTPF
jgi:hypothetical protein